MDMSTHLTNDHDVLSYAIGKAVLSGVYDEQENKGFVSIGILPNRICFALTETLIHLYKSKIRKGKIKMFHC